MTRGVRHNLNNVSKNHVVPYNSDAYICVIPYQTPAAFRSKLPHSKHAPEQHDSEKEWELEEKPAVRRLRFELT